MDNLHTQGLEVSIASSENLILNSSNPHLIGAALRPKQAEWLTPEQLKHPEQLVTVPAGKLGLAPETTVYLIPVEVEDHLLGYVQVVANFGDFAQPLAAEPDARADVRVCDFRDRTGVRVYPGRSLREADSCGRGCGAEYRGARPGAGARRRIDATRSAC